MGERGGVREGEGVGSQRFGCVRETGERMEQQQSSPLERRSWRAWEMSMGEGGMK